MWIRSLAALALGCAVACGSRDEFRADRRVPAAALKAAPAASPSTPAPSKLEGLVPNHVEGRPRVVVLGDSLTAGLGLPSDQAYPAVLQRRLNDAGLGYDVVNAGVSGDTSAGGLRRLDWALDGDVRVLIVALGGNDALRGLQPDELKRNLAQIIERAQARGVRVVLAGMDAPPNWGRGYIVAFHQVYPSVAAEYHVAFVPFLLAGVGGHDELNQNDGIHPTVAGARIVADNVWAVLEPLAKQQQQRATRSEGRPGS